MREEILVHVTAPARVADDQKYRTLAHNIASFEPITCRRLDAQHNIQDDHSTEATEGSNDAVVLSSTRRSHNNSGADKSQVHEHFTSARTTVPSLKRQRISPAPIHRGHDQNLTNSRTSTSRVVKRHCHRYHLSEDLPSSSYNILHLERPHTAAGSSIPHILVPDTDSISRRARIQFDPPSVLDQTVIPNSQPSIDSTRSTSEDPRPGTSLSSTASDELTASISSSQRRAVMSEARPSVHAARSAHVTSSPINLITPETTFEKRESHYYSTSMTRSLMTASAPTGSDKQELRAMLRAITALPEQVLPPSLAVSRGEWETFLTPKLQSFDLHDTKFRMILHRDVYFLERAYWRIPITIGGFSDVKAMRKQSSRRAPPALRWTAPEFLNFWHHLKLDIRSQDYGDISLFRTAPELLIEDNATIQLVLRVYCWGEVFAEVLMLLLAISNGLLTNCALQYIGSRHKDEIIAQSGTAHRTCRLTKTKQHVSIRV